MNPAGFDDAPGRLLEGELPADNESRSLAHPRTRPQAPQNCARMLAVDCILRQRRRDDGTRFMEALGRRLSDIQTVRGRKTESPPNGGNPLRLWRAILLVLVLVMVAGMVAKVSLERSARPMADKPGRSPVAASVA